MIGCCILGSWELYIIEYLVHLFVRKTLNLAQKSLAENVMHTLR